MIVWGKIENVRNSSEFWTIGLQDINIYENRVLEALNKHVKERKGYGADMVKSSDLKLVANFATNGLLIVFKNYVRKCTFLSQWKVRWLKALFYNWR